MKSINLKSFIQAKSTMNSEQFQQFKDYTGCRFSNQEIDGVNLLYPDLNLKDYSGFHMGYTIPQISKEFDILRFGENYIINLELKSKSTIDKMLKQLKQNKYYLKPFELETYHFVFVSSDNKLYQLENDNLIESEFSILNELFNNQKVTQIDLDKEFSPVNYLVSPFNHPYKFLNGEYFMTDQQQAIIKKIDLFLQDDRQFFASLRGQAGTGKTLVVYDLAKEKYISEKKVAVIHCGDLNEGQHTLNNSKKLKIFAAKDCRQIIEEKYRVIIIDEAQRMYKDQLESLCEYAKENGAKVIFAYDEKQYLASYEKKRDNHSFIEMKVDSKNRYQLTNNIRTNVEIIKFVNNLFHPRLSKNEEKNDSVSFEYFNDFKDVESELQKLREAGWYHINYTTSQYNPIHFDKYQEYSGLNAHKVIGQEFDKVVVVIDTAFYLEGNTLKSQQIKGLPYCMEGMLHQAITRARKYLKIIILNNSEIMAKCIHISK